jgi:hypothetical protein
VLLTVGVAVTAADTAGGGDRGSLYVAVSAVVVSLVGAFVALRTNRNRVDEHPNVRYVDPPTSNALPAAMAELYEHIHDELERMTIERDLWRRRALQAGWDE